MALAIAFNPCTNCNEKEMCLICELDMRRNGNIDAVSQWIPVTERLPEQFGKYLVRTPKFTWLIWYSPGCGFYDSDPEWGDIEMDDVTHWMPLPDPPKGSDEDGSVHIHD